MIWKVNKKINFANLCNTNINCFFTDFSFDSLSNEK